MSRRSWWAQRYELAHEVERLYTAQGALGHRKNLVLFTGATRWRDYLRDGLHEYLRRYVFFLEEGQAPAAHDRLPEV